MMFTPTLVDISEGTMAALLTRLAPQQKPTIDSAIANNSIPEEFKVFSLATTGFSAVKDNILAWAGLTFQKDEPRVQTHYYVRQWYDGSVPDEELDVFEDRLAATHAKLSTMAYWPYGRPHMDKYGLPQAEFDESLRNFLREPQVMVSHKAQFDISFVSNYLQDSWENLHEGGRANVFDTLAICKAAFAGMEAPRPTEYADYTTRMITQYPTITGCSLFPHVEQTYSLNARSRLLPTRETDVDKEMVVQKIRTIYALMLTWQAFVGYKPVQPSLYTPAVVVAQ